MESGAGEGIPASRALLRGVVLALVISGAGCSPPRDDAVGSDATARPPAEAPPVRQAAASPAPRASVPEPPATRPVASMTPGTPSSPSAAGPGPGTDPAPPPPGDLRAAASTNGAAGAEAFASDWSTETGSSKRAVTDGGAWNILVCSSFANVLTVVPGAPVGFTLSRNVLRVQMRGPNHCGMLQREDAVPIQTTHWGRVWIRNDENGTQNYHAGAYHNAHGSDDIQGVPLGRDATTNDGTWRINVIIQAPYPYNQWRSPPLRNGVWYRYEWEMRYLTATTYRIYPRVYDEQGALLHDQSRFRQNDYSRPTDMTLDRYWALDGGTRATSLGGGNPGGANAELARNFGLGTEGPASASDTGGYWYYARFALSTTGWIGR